jgi:hypothetical protein
VVSVGCWAITHLDSLAFPLAVELLCLCTPSFGQLSWRLLGRGCWSMQKA